MMKCKPSGLVERAQEEPVSNEGGEDHAGNHNKDDSNTGDGL